MSFLKPVGVFWDIENCCVPKGKSALKIIERIREKFFQDYREAEFICVCDINKESEATIKELNDGQINVVHINAVAKNAADDKIRQSLRRFSDSHPPGTRVILISSDVNFASELSDLRHRKKFDVVLIHKAQVSEALLSCATQHFLYENLIQDLPDRAGYKQELRDHVLVIYGYSKEGSIEKVKQTLKMLSNNCGGRVLSIGSLFAILKFDTPELLERAKKRMNGEDVYGRKITVCLPEETPFYNTIRKLTAAYLSKRQESPSPQRRPGARGYTPETYRGDYMTDSVPGCGVGIRNVMNDLNSASAVSDRAQKTHVRQHSGGSVLDGHSISPSHTHTLPNSNSEKYYHKSSPSSSDNSSGTVAKPLLPDLLMNPTSLTSGLGAGDGGSYVLGDLSRAATSSGQTITVFKPSDERRLEDIPIPSFGFRDIPPPPLPFIGRTNSTAQSSTFDPIKLIETASLDTRAVLQSQANWYSSDPAHKSASVHRPHNRVTSSDLLADWFSRQSLHSQFTASGFPPSPSTFEQLGPVQQSPTAGSVTSSQHQSRSLSVPANQVTLGGGNTASPQDADLNFSMPKNHDQNTSCFKMPFAPTSNRLFQKPAASLKLDPDKEMVGNRGRSFDIQKRLSSDEDRAFSPVPGFRPRLASAPSSAVTSPCPDKRANSPLISAPMTRARVKQHGSNLYRVPTPAEIGDPCVDYEQPGFNARCDPYVEVMVSNLDYNIHPREWKKIIYATFHPHVQVLSIQVRLQADLSSVATVRLPTEQDARFAISQFHRRKIGYKRINVQLKTDSLHSPADVLRTDTIALLMEVKDNKMPLSRLIDLFDKRFHKTVSVSDVYKMRDIVQILEVAGAGRWVRLQPGISRSPTPGSSFEEAAREIQEQAVCPIHCPETSTAYAEALNCCMLSNVIMLRKHFSPQLHSLLLSHNGYIPLMSFPACFAAEFQEIEPAKEGGIPLEHLISCVPGVEIVVSKIGVKIIQFQENRDQFQEMAKGSSWQELGKISREVMELLRQQVSCCMPVSKFIPSYHHHFGRQCRVADYGYTKLQDLFEAIPHAVQVLGTGDRRVITLSPRAQIKRASTDIVKVVKGQPAKQIWLHEFPQAYEKVIGRALCLPHYGVCYMEDVLADIPTTTLIVIEEDKNILLCLPRRDQTAEEVEKTKQFAVEVVDLLKHHPQCQMPFNKFIPAYHHHFGRQCRVADYGFGKLTDLFESVAHIVEIEEEGEERMIHLTHWELQKVLCEQLTSLIRPSGAIPLSQLLVEYAQHLGFCLKLEDFGVTSVRALLNKLRNHVKIEVRSGEEYVTLVQESHLPVLGLRVLQLLMDESGGSLPVMELCTRYQSKFGHTCQISQIREELSDYVQIDESEHDAGGVIRLSCNQMLARNIRLLLLHHARIFMSDLCGLYYDHYGVELSPALYGFSSLFNLLLSFPHILEIKGKSPHKYIQSAGVLSEPETLPPSRVDVTYNYHSQTPEPMATYDINSSRGSPWQNSPSLCRTSSRSHVATPVFGYAPNDQGTSPASKGSFCMNETSPMSGSSSGGGGGSSSFLSSLATPVSDLLRASQLWDPSLPLQVVGSCSLNQSSSFSLPGPFPTRDSQSGICSTTSSAHLDHRHESGRTVYQQTASQAAAADWWLHGRLPGQDEEDDLFAVDSPFNSGSFRSSSRNSASSPVKRKTRIAAHFNLSH